MFASQTQKTTSLEIMLGYSVAQNPSPGMWVFPSEKSKDTFVSERLKPTILINKQLSELLADRGRAITNKLIDFNTMPLYLE